MDPGTGCSGNCVWEFGIENAGRLELALGVPHVTVVTTGLLGVQALEDGPVVMWLGALEGIPQSGATGTGEVTKPTLPTLLQLRKATGLGTLGACTVVVTQVRFGAKMLRVGEANTRRLAETERIGDVEGAAEGDRLQGVTDLAGEETR